jgi:hypothetical protein
MNTETAEREEDSCPPWGWEHTRMLIIWVTATIAFCGSGGYIAVLVATHIYGYGP